MIRKLIKDITPPFLLRWVSGLFYGWYGNYSSWPGALKRCSGYESSNILEKVKKSALKVRDGKAAYERDSVLFSNTDYNYQLAVALMWMALKKNNKINVLDFGGSLGSSYFRNRQLFTGTIDLKWNIVEQERFVKTGREYFTDDVLKFYFNIDECLKENTADIIILSSVLPYLEEPYIFLESVINREFAYVFIDKMPFIDGQDRLTVQKVNPLIYKASYPCWFFNESKFMDFMTKKYSIIFSYDNGDKANIRSCFKGYLYKLNGIG